MELGDLYPHLDAEHGVEVGERLVEEEDLRLAHQRPADRHALALAAGELRRPPVEQPLELEHRGDLVGALLDERLRRLGDAQAEGDVLRHRHMRVERVGLEDHGDPALGRRHVGDVGAGDMDGALGHRLEPGDHPEQRGLAAAGGPEESAELAAIDGQIEVLDRLDIAVALLDAPQLDFDHLVPQSWPCPGPAAITSSRHEPRLISLADEQGQSIARRAGRPRLPPRGQPLKWMASRETPLPQSSLTLPLLAPRCTSLDPSHELWGGTSRSTRWSGQAGGA